MKAVVWHGKHDIRVDSVADPEVVEAHDVVVRVKLTAICGSDLHLYDGCVPTMRAGDILGHEFMGEVVEVGRAVESLRVGDRVVVPFNISCGQCFFCKREQFSLCDNSNPNGWISEELFGQPASGLFGYSHLMGGYAGGQAEYVRVPFADVGCLRLDDDVSDEEALFLSDVLPTGYMAAANCNITAGDVVAVWGCGPVGQFAIRSALLLGADRVLAIDDVPERLHMAKSQGAETIDLREGGVLARLQELTGGRGPDACIDAVGMEAHGGLGLDGGLYDAVKQKLRPKTDRLAALRLAITACRKGGTVSIPGVYAGLVDKLPLGAAFGKGLTLRMGQTHVQKYMRPLLDLIRSRALDPSFVITHRLQLSEAPSAYRMFRDKQDGCIKVVLRPD